MIVVLGKMRRGNRTFQYVSGYEVLHGEMGSSGYTANMWLANKVDVDLPRIHARKLILFYTLYNV